MKRIERDKRGVAIRLFPFTRKRDAGTTVEAPRLIAIDPAVAFGRSVIVGSRVPTSEIAERFQAGESPSELAEDFGRTKKKSGKRSAASSQPPPDPVTFYVDECLGRHVPGELTAAGYDIRP